MSDSEGRTRYRNRSRSPVRERRNNNNNDDYEDRGINGRRRENRQSSFRRSPRDYNNNGRNSYNNSRGRLSGGRFGSRRRFNNRGDYGPLLDKDLDSSYNEKVNRNYENSIFVGNLTYDTHPEDLKEYFSQVGDVIRADIITSKGHHRGMGTVEFSTANAVDAAIEKLNGSFLLDRQIFVRQDNPPPESENDKHEKRFNKPQRDDNNSPRHTKNNFDRPSHQQDGFEIFVANISYSTTWQTLKDLFRECGEVLRADVELDRQGYSRGFGLVIMANEADAKTAIEKFNGYELEGRKLDVREGHGKKALSESDRPGRRGLSSGHDDKDLNTKATSSFADNIVGGGERNCLVHCSNLPFSTARSDLFDLFGAMGKLKQAELRYDAENKPTGIAVVEYVNIEDAEDCVERLNNYNYGGCDLDISYGNSNE